MKSPLDAQCEAYDIWKTKNACAMPAYCVMVYNLCGLIVSCHSYAIKIRCSSIRNSRLQYVNDVRVHTVTRDTGETSSLFILRYNVNSTRWSFKYQRHKPHNSTQSACTTPCHPFIPSTRHIQFWNIHDSLFIKMCNGRQKWRHMKLLGAYEY